MENGTPTSSAPEIPNAAGVPTVDTSNVVETPPAWTSDTPQREAQAPVEGDGEGEGEGTQGGEGGQPAGETQVETPAYQPKYTPEQIEQLAKQADYVPQEVEINFLDELGNFDPQKFGEFMAENNKNIFNQALQAGNARTQLTQVEQDTWAHVEKDFPEIAGNDTLTKALRGARIQDIIAGGDGDLTRLATDIVGPIRDNRIKAVEDANQNITDQKKLGTFTPEGASTEAPTLSLMQQLQVAVQSGDTQKATSLRHAIRKERINANN